MYGYIGIDKDLQGFLGMCRDIWGYIEVYRNCVWSGNWGLELGFRLRVSGYCTHNSQKP